MKYRFFPSTKPLKNFCCKIIYFETGDGPKPPSQLQIKKIDLQLKPCVTRIKHSNHYNNFYLHKHQTSVVCKVKK